MAKHDGKNKTHHPSKDMVLKGKGWAYVGSLVEKDDPLGGQKGGLRYEMCTKKIGHLTWDEAQSALRRRPEKGFHSYRCPWCELWHNGHR